MSDRNWKENNTRENDDTIWDKDKDPVIMGVLSKVEHNIGSHESTMYTVKKDNDELVKIWGSTVLDDRFLGVPQGTYVKVSYEGLKKGKAGKSYHNYKVFIDEDSINQAIAPDEPTIDIEDQMPPDDLQLPDFR